MKKLTLLALTSSALIGSALFLSGCSIRQFTTSKQEDTTIEAPAVQEEPAVEVSPASSPEISTSKDLDIIQQELDDTEIEDDFGTLLTPSN